MKKVFIVGSRGYCQYTQMYKEDGWEIAADPHEVGITLAQFTGGADVHPSYYGEIKHSSSNCDLYRDAQEKEYYQYFLHMGIPMVGICRGGQFLNVMNGGKMYQDVDGHAIRGTHAAIDINRGCSYQVTSTHHQMMCPSDKAIIIAVAYESTYQIHMEGASIAHTAFETDTEVVFYEDTKCLCFQPHPEYGGDIGDTREYFFSLLNEYILEV